VKWYDVLNKPDTSGVPENVSNLYYTDTRVRATMSAGQGLNLDRPTSVFTANAALTIALGVVALSDSTSNTSISLAATANAVYSANINATVAQ
jgi:hypothetical protein